MKYDFCTVRHNPPETYGDCMRACVSTLIGNNPPHFFHDGCDGDTGANRLNEWLAQFGYISAWTYFTDDYTLDEIMHMHGHNNPGVPAILIGSNRYDEAHCVCIEGGELLHDPSLNRCTVTDPQCGYWSIVYIVKK